MFEEAKSSIMSKYIKYLTQSALGIVLIVSGFGIITPVAHAEAPTGNSYLALSPIESLHGQIASVFKKDADVTPEVVVDGLTATERAAKIEQFFKSRDNSPMAAYAKVFVDKADQYGLDWKLVAAISTIESNGGQEPCKFHDGSLKYNAFGWGGCTIAFNSYEQAIDTITKNLAGLDPKTEQHYKGKTISQIINAYNPPHIRGDYNYLVTMVMKKIATTEVSTSADEIAMK